MNKRTPESFVETLQKVTRNVVKNLISILIILVITGALNLIGGIGVQAQETLKQLETFKSDGIKHLDYAFTITDDVVEYFREEGGDKKQAIENFYTWCRGYVEFFNQAFINSGAESPNMRIVHLDYDIDGEIFGDARDALQDLAVNERIKAVQIEVGADHVSKGIIFRSGARGSAPVLPKGMIPRLGTSISATHIHYYTALHEYLHTNGAGHQEKTHDTEDDAKAFLTQDEDGSWRATVMFSAAGTSNVVAPVISNPDTEYLGKSWGDSTHNNLRSVEKNLPYVQNFFEHSEPIDVAPLAYNDTVDIKRGEINEIPFQLVDYEGDDLEIDSYQIEGPIDLDIDNFRNVMIITPHPDAQFGDTYKITFRGCQDGGINLSNSAYVTGSILQSTGIEFNTELATALDIVVYPNPVSDVLHLTINCTVNVLQTDIILCDIQGRRVGVLLNQQDILQGQTHLEFDIGNLSPGIYFVRFIFSNGGSKSIRIVKQ